MARYINPAFRRFHKEAALIGHLLASFGEIELSVCRNAAHSQNELFNVIMKALYGIRVTSTRIDTANRLMQQTYALNGLEQEYNTCMRMVRHCLKIRNQFSHCNWGDDPAAIAGLYFADLQDSVETDDFSHDWKHVDPVLLQEQVDYFGASMELLDFLHSELAVKQGQIEAHAFPMPIVQRQPPLHNPPELHVPPWLNEDQKVLHVARALASQGGVPTPTPAQQALDKARAEKKARQRAQIDRSRQGGKGSSSPYEPEK